MNKMNNRVEFKKETRWIILGAAAITLISLYPQFVMWVQRGRDWNGAYAQIQGDEWLYSAYVQSLIDGRPRRNDAFTGQVDSPDHPLP
jgi:hypothetical protein